MRWALPVAALGYHFFLRPQMRKWGTRLGESQRRLAGDDIVPKPNFQMTHAVNIDAPPEAIWPWLAQMGRERTGYYGLDLLTNQGIPSVNFIRQDIPGPEIDMAMDGGFRIVALEPNRKFLFGGFDLQRLPGITQEVSMLYLLEHRQDGSTRLLIRQRAFTYGIFSVAFNVIYEMLCFIALIEQRRQLKQLAEDMKHLSS